MTNPPSGGIEIAFKKMCVKSVVYLLCMGLFSRFSIPPRVDLHRVLTRRFVKLRTGFQPIFLGPSQCAFGAGARLAELRGLLGIAGEQVGQSERSIDLGDDAVDAFDLGLGF